jgi:glycosyltransferase involved in cell wall biosynthesis
LTNVEFRLAAEASRPRHRGREASGASPLKVAAKVDAADKQPLTREITPLLDQPLIEFAGEIGDAEKAAFLDGALALLFPVDWPEPFGLIMIEAMACGTQ